MDSPLETDRVSVPDDDRSESVRHHFGRLYNIMRELRRQCPWDREQTHETLRQYLLEETYEVLESLDQRRYDELCKEMGDLMLQVLFHSRIASENRRFDLVDVLQLINDKLIRRHPHVFGTVEANNAEQALRNWEQIKLQEADRTSVLDGVPKALPALVRAYRVQEKASRVSFDWNDVRDVWPKVHEEIREVQEAATGKDTKRIEDEMGDLLFTVVNVCRFLAVNPEDALRGTIEKFIRRFRYVENKYAEMNRNMKDSTLEELDQYWDEAKKKGV